MDLVCVGDVMLDVHVASGALARGGDVHGRVAIRPGGTSANAAVWAAWAGASSAVIAAVGDDLAGTLCVEAVASRGVDVGGVVRRASSTGVMVVMSEDGDRSMVADRGAVGADRTVVVAAVVVAVERTEIAVVAVDRRAADRVGAAATVRRAGVGHSALYRDRHCSFVE